MQSTGAWCWSVAVRRLQQSGTARRVFLEGLVCVYLARTVVQYEQEEFARGDLGSKAAVGGPTEVWMFLVTVARYRSTLRIHNKRKSEFFCLIN